MTSRLRLAREKATHFSNSLVNSIIFGSNRSDYTESETSIRALSGSDVIFQSFSRNSTGIGGLSRNSTPEHHAEQYRHFTGQVFATIRPIAQRIAKQPLRVARKVKVKSKNYFEASRLTKNRKDRKKLVQMGVKRRQEEYVNKQLLPGFMKAYSEDIDILENHPLLDLINDPNPFFVRWSLFYVTVVSLELTGKAYWWIFKNEEGKEELWPLPSSWIEAEHEEGIPFAKWKICPEGAGEPFLVSRDDIVYLHYPNPSDPFDAVAPLQAQARSVIADENIAEAQRKSFTNGLWPGVAFIVGKNVDIQDGTATIAARPILRKPQREQLIAAIKQQYRGVQLMDEPIILDGMIEDVKKITNTPREMDFLNSSNATEKRINKGFGVNPIIQGEVENANRASSSTADDHFVSTCVNPKIELLSECLTKYLSFRYGDDLIIFIEEAKSFDPDLERMNEDSMWTKAAISVNEIRARKGMYPIEGGDVCYVPRGMVPIRIIKQEDEDVTSPEGTEIGLPLGSGGAGGGDFSFPGVDDILEDVGNEHNENESDEEDEEADDEEEEESDENENEERSHRRRNRFRRVRKEPWERNDLFINHCIECWSKGQLTGEKKLKKEYLEFLQKEKNRIEKEISSRSEITPKVISQVFDLSGFATRMKESLINTLVEIAKRGAKTEWNLHGPNRRAFTKAPIPNAVLNRVEKKTRGFFNFGFFKTVVGTIIQRVKNLVTRLSGREPEVIKEKVIETISQDSAKRKAEGFAITESTTTMNIGQHESRDKLGELGIIKSKRWVTMRDESVRPAHRDCEGQTVLLNDYFDCGGRKCLFPCDPSLPASLRCNCRCTTVSIRR